MEGIAHLISFRFCPLKSHSGVFLQGGSGEQDRHVSADVTQWEYGLMIDQWSRYSGCNVRADWSKALGWYYLLVLPPLVLLYLYVALELYRHDPMSSPSRIQGMVYFAVGAALYVPMLSNAAVDPQTPVSSKLAVSLAGGIGVQCFCVGAWRMIIGHYVASCFQMVSRLETGRDIREVVEREVQSDSVKLSLMLCRLHFLVGFIHHRFTP
jgi:hypothetical protein